jgi:twitching motility two-component system response regulator PilH
MHIKVVVKKRAPEAQISDKNSLPEPSRETSPSPEENSSLMLVPEENAGKATAGLKKEMKDRLATISELKLKLGKLVDSVLDEFVRLQALDLRIAALEKGLSRKAHKKRQKKDRQAPGETEKPDEFLPEEREKESLKQEMECLQTVQHLLKSMNNLPDLLAVASSPPQPGAMAGPVNGKKKILIVEDDPVSRKLLNHFLEKENYTVLTAASAEEGFQSFGREKPDLILLDIMLPGADGFQFLSRLKENEPGPPPPVFVISSLAQESDIVKALQAGAVDYILKPFSPQVILVKISQLFRSGR